MVPSPELGRPREQGGGANLKRRADKPAQWQDERQRSIHPCTHRQVTRHGGSTQAELVTGSSAEEEPSHSRGRIRETHWRDCPRTRVLAGRGGAVDTRPLARPQQGLVAAQTLTLGPAGPSLEPSPQSAEAQRGVRSACNGVWNQTSLSPVSHLQTPLTWLPDHSTGK